LGRCKNFASALSRAPGKLVLAPTLHPPLVAKIVLMRGRLRRRKRRLRRPIMGKLGLRTDHKLSLVGSVDLLEEGKPQ